jgi:cysteine desulfurase
MKPVYLDNAATTQIRNEVVDKMFKIAKSNYGNPSSTHSFGRGSRTLV